MRLLLDADTPGRLREIADLLQNAGQPPLTPDEKSKWPVPINDWWIEGKVECKEERWAEMVKSMPWLLQKVQITLFISIHAPDSVL
jgi:hypothetical protein